MSPRRRAGSAFLGSASVYATAHDVASGVTAVLDDRLRRRRGSAHGDGCEERRRSHWGQHAAEAIGRRHPRMPTEVGESGVMTDMEINGGDRQRHRRPEAPCGSRSTRAVRPGRRQRRSGCWWRSDRPGSTTRSWSACRSRPSPEQFRVDVSRVDDELRASSSRRPGTTSSPSPRWSGSATSPPRLHAALDTLFGPSEWPTPRRHPVRDVWETIDEFMRAVARHHALDPTTTELVRLRGRPAARLPALPVPARRWRPSRPAPTRPTFSVRGRLRQQRPAGRDEGRAGPRGRDDLDPVGRPGRGHGRRTRAPHRRAGRRGRARRDPQRRQQDRGRAGRRRARGDRGRAAVRDRRRRGLSTV